VKVFVSKVATCCDCPVGSRRITSHPRSEPVCKLFMDAKEPGRRGRAMTENVYTHGVPDWCHLDDILDGNMTVVANETVYDETTTWSSLKKRMVAWRDISHEKQV